MIQSTNTKTIPNLGKCAQGTLKKVNYKADVVANSLTVSIKHLTLSGLVSG